MTLETLSARDKFWLHPVVGLRYETTPDQMRIVIEGVRQMLARQAEVDGPSIRVRFVRLNTFSLDVEVFAYLYARDWTHFLEIQESLLLTITDIIAAAGHGPRVPVADDVPESRSGSATGQRPDQRGLSHTVCHATDTVRKFVPVRSTIPAVYATFSV